MENKEINFYRCHFEGFNCCLEYGIVNGEKVLNLGDFGKELKQLMEKYHIKEICPTHWDNAQIARHINDDEIHIVGMYFTAE